MISVILVITEKGIIIDWNRLPQTAVLSDSFKSFGAGITSSNLYIHPIFLHIFKVTVFSYILYFSFFFFVMQFPLT